MEWQSGQFIVSDDIELIDLAAVQRLLSSTYWAAGRSREVIARSMEHSLCFGLYHNDHQIGFARVITDRTVFSWILDVIVDEEYRGRGLGTWLMEVILDHPEIKHTKMNLATKDAQPFYARLGFEARECMRREPSV